MAGRIKMFGVDLNPNFYIGENKAELQRANMIIAEEQPKLEAALAVVADLDARLRALDVEQKSLDLEKLLP